MSIGKLALGFKRVTDFTIKLFNSIYETIYAQYDKILKYSNNRSTNASTESFNGKIKAFRTTPWGRKRSKISLFRKIKIYAKININLKHQLLLFILSNHRPLRVIRINSCNSYPIENPGLS